MPTSYVSGSVRAQNTYGDYSLTCDVKAASPGQTQVAIALMRPKASDFSVPAGWTQRANISHPDGQSRLLVMTRAAGAGGLPDETITIGKTGTINSGKVVTCVINGAYLAIATATDSNWPTTHTAPAAALTGGGDFTVRAVASATYNRTWSGWTGSATAISGTGFDVGSGGAGAAPTDGTSGGPDMSVAYKSGETGSAAALNATCNDTEQSFGVTIVFKPLAGGTEAEFVGNADTVAIASVALTGTSYNVGQSGGVVDIPMQIRGGDGTVPIVNARVSISLAMPSGEATAAQLADTDANGNAVIRVTGGATATPVGGRAGTLSVRYAGKSSNDVSITVVTATGSKVARVNAIDTTLLQGGATPTSGWYAMVWEQGSAPLLTGAPLFLASGVGLSSDGSGGYRADIPVPGGVSIAFGTPVIVRLSRAATIAAGTTAEVTDLMPGTVAAV